MDKPVHCIYERRPQGYVNIVACFTDLEYGKGALERYKINNPGREFFYKSTTLVGEEEHVQSHNAKQA